MTKNQIQKEPDVKTEQKPRSDALRLAMFCCVVMLVTLSFLTWRSIDQIQIGLESRLNRVEKQLENIAASKAPVAADSQPGRGPDPNRAYSINTAGAPIKGPTEAVVTIAEFSDFQ